MQIRLLQPFQMYKANQIVSLASDWERYLILNGQATYDLTGGVPYIEPPVRRLAPASLVLNDSGAAVGLDGPGDAIIPVGGSGGGGAADIPFSLAIPLTSGGNAYMPPQNVAGAMAFTPAADAVRGSLVYLRLKANGSNVPTFNGFKEWGASLGYDNTSGVVNQLQFFFDGVDAFYTASQAVVAATAPGDTTAPVRQSATVNGSTLVVAFNEALNTAAPALSSFSYVLNAGAAVNPTAVSVSGSNVTLTFATAALQGQTATLSYTPGTNPIRDAAGNAVAAFSGVAVTNNTPASDTTAPVLQSAVLNGNTLVMTYNEALASTAPTLGSISLVLGAGAAASPTAATVAGVTVTATFATSATPGQSAALTYTPGASAIRDSAGNNAAAMTGYAVTNSTAAAGTDAPLQFAADPTYYAESVDSDGNYVYTSTSAIGSGYQALAAMCGTKSLPKDADGGFWFTSASSLNTLIGFMQGASAPGRVVFSSWDYSVIDPSTGQAYTTRIKAAQTVSTVLKQDGDIVGIFLVGGAVIARVARASAPTVWIDIATIATGVSLKLWPLMQSQQHPSERKFTKPRYTGGLV